MDQRRSIETMVGKGTYSVSEAARLTGVPAQRVYRWLRGRSRTYDGTAVFDGPLWTPELPPIDGDLYLGFRDLVELRMVDRFRRERLSLPYIRKVVRTAQSILNDSHPFTSGRFKSDGKRLYLEILSSTQEPQLIEILKGQYAFHSIISEGLRDLEFENGTVVRWLPRSGRGDVVIDPTRSFGQPVLGASGIPTATINLQAEAGRTPRQLASDFEIEERSVRSALAFEQQLAA